MRVTDGDLAERMDAGVGPPGAGDGDRSRLRAARKRVFEQPLD